MQAKGKPQGHSSLGTVPSTSCFVLFCFWDCLSHWSETPWSVRQTDQRAPCTWIHLSLPSRCRSKSTCFWVPVIVTRVPGAKSPSLCGRPSPQLQMLDLLFSRLHSLVRCLQRTTMPSEAKMQSNEKQYEPSSAPCLAGGGRHSYFLALSVNPDSQWSRGWKVSSCPIPMERLFPTVFWAMWGYSLHFSAAETEARESVACSRSLWLTGDSESNPACLQILCVLLCKMVSLASPRKGSQNNPYFTLPGYWGI